MRINGEIKPDKITLDKLETGKCFVFTDGHVENTANLYLMTDLDIIVNLNNGDAFNYYDARWEDRPVRIIDVELNIL